MRWYACNALLLRWFLFLIFIVLHSGTSELPRSPLSHAYFLFWNLPIHKCSTGKHLFPFQKAEIWHGPSDPQKVIQLHHWEYLDWWQLHDRKALQRVMSTAQYITGAELPAIQDLHTRRCNRKAKTFSKTPATQAIDCSHRYHTENSTSAPSLEPVGP